MVGVRDRKKMFSRVAFVLSLLALGALLAACAAPTGASGQASIPQAAPTSAPAATTAPAASEAPAASAGLASEVSFSKDVMPIFEQTCVKCHGGSEGAKGDLSLKSYADMLKGGQHGPAINPSDANGSLLVKQIQSGKMPKRAAKLPQDQIALIVKWVTEGAKNN